MATWIETRPHFHGASFFGSRVDVHEIQQRKMPESRSEENRHPYTGGDLAILSTDVVPLAGCSSDA